MIADDVHAMVDSLSKSVNFDLVEKPGMGTNDISSAGFRRSFSSVSFGMSVKERVFALERWS